MLRWTKLFPGPKVHVTSLCYASVRIFVQTKSNNSEREMLLHAISFHNLRLNAECRSIIPYAAKIQDNIQEYMMPADLKRMYDALNVVREHVDKILWVGVAWSCSASTNAVKFTRETEPFVLQSSLAIIYGWNFIKQKLIYWEICFIPGIHLVFLIYFLVLFSTKRHWR